MSSAVPVGAFSGARGYMMASTAHVEKGHARGGVYTWMVHCGCARHTRDAWSPPRTMFAARISSIPEGSTTIPSASPPLRPPGVQGHFCLARVGDSVDGLLDVHAAPGGLIQNPALRHPVAQGGACGRVSHGGQRSVIGAWSGVSLGAPVFSGAVTLFPRGAEGGQAARWQRRFRGLAACGGLWDYLQVRVRARVLLWEISFTASESQRPDDLVCRVQRRRPVACFVWGRGFRHCCVAVANSRGWGAEFPWPVHVLWARWGVGGGARTLALRAGVRVFV